MLRRTVKEMTHPQELRIPWNEMKWTNYRMCMTTRTKRKYNKWSLSRGGYFGVWRIGERRRRWEEAYGNLSGRTALENCGFELACTISRCLLRPSACGVGWVEGSANEIAGGPRGDCIQAHIETHPRDVSELSANRMSAFYRRHHLPRCDVHPKEKGRGGFARVR